MERLNLLDRILIINPARRGLAEWACMVIVGIAGLFFSWPTIPWMPYVNIFGALLFGLGLLLHIFCEKTHKQAHENSEHIHTIVTTGLYAKVRHPIYLSLIMMDIGLGLIFGIVAVIVLALIFSYLWILTALTEEKFLLQKFPNIYRQYMQEVKCRLIPNFF
ncbi:MAG: isoprenylcysteine carboxylmethyltransferase family protein [Candidatus Vecturithrix sp.]|jgi:protein-S-isoprenylcysteine O-methyltransferase Ste14|nr:isoprenylcysteine carboxylmethyltransferase family protein [Candidatus Vecturithrix sp.]